MVDVLEKLDLKDVLELTSYHTQKTLSGRKLCFSRGPELREKRERVGGKKNTYEELSKD